MITAVTAEGRRVTVRPLRWTRKGCVQVAERCPWGGRFYAVPVFYLQHDKGRDALARELATLPRENSQ